MKGVRTLRKLGDSLRFAAGVAARRRRITLVVGAAAALMLVQGALALAGAPPFQAMKSSDSPAVRAPVAALAQTNASHGKVIVGRSYKSDHSAAIRSYPKQPLSAQAEHEVSPNPHVASLHKNRPDAAVQRTAAKPNMPGPILNFDGIPFPGVACNCAPPDTNGEVGLTQYVQIVNEGFQVFNKTTGASVFGPVGIATLLERLRRRL